MNLYLFLLVYTYIYSLPFLKHSIWTNLIGHIIVTGFNNERLTPERFDIGNSNAIVCREHVLTASGILYITVNLLGL